MVEFICWAHYSSQSRWLTIDMQGSLCNAGTAPQLYRRQGKTVDGDLSESALCFVNVYFRPTSRLTGCSDERTYFKRVIRKIFMISKAAIQPFMVLFFSLLPQTLKVF